MPILLTIAFVLAPDSVALKQPIYPAPSLDAITRYVDSSYKAGDLNEYEYRREKDHLRSPKRLYAPTIYDSPFNRREQA